MSQEHHEIVMQLIDEIPNMTEAIRCSIRLARLTDKQVYLELGIDGGQWARIMNGNANFPHEKFTDLMAICRNNMPLEWLAKQSGYEVRLIKSSFEELLEKERKEKELLRLQLDGIIELLKAAKLP